jgi:hypothetical protein
MDSIEEESKGVQDQRCLMRRRIIVGIIENKGKWFCMTVSNFVVAGSGRESGVGYGATEVIS